MKFKCYTVFIHKSLGSTTKQIHAYESALLAEEVRKHQVRVIIAKTANLSCMYFYIDQNGAVSVLNLIIIFLYVKQAIKKEQLV